MNTDVQQVIRELHDVQYEDVLHKYNCMLIVEELQKGNYSDVAFSDVDLILLLEGIVGR